MARERDRQPRSSSLDEWDQQTVDLLEGAYLAAGDGPRGSGSSSSSEGDWRAKRQHLAVPMTVGGDWLDIGCANGHLLVTLPGWIRERGVEIRPHGLELIASVAELARRLHPDLSDRIWTGSAMTWEPPRRFRYVTALDSLAPPGQLGDLVDRLLERYLSSGGRLILSSYTDTGATPRRLLDDLRSIGHRPDGIIHIDRPGRQPLQSVWFDRA